MTNTKLTEKERTVLTAIVDNEYQDYEDGDRDVIGSPTWLCVVSDYSYQGKTFSGICSSLAEKGYIGTSQDTGTSIGVNDATIWITEDGFNALYPG